MNYPLLYQWEQLLSAHLPSLNSWQHANVALFSYGVMECESCQQGAIARAVNCGESLDSTMRRLRRLLDNEALVVGDFCGEWVKWVSEALGKQEITLLVDETKVHERIGVMMVGLAWEGRCLPLAWRTYKANDAQAYPAEGQVGMIAQLLAAVKTGLPSTTQVLVLADRGIGTSPDLCKVVEGLGWHYLFRVTCQTKIVTAQQEYTIAQHVQPGDIWAMSGAVFKRRGHIPAQARALWSVGYDEPWALVTNDERLTGHEYARRNWQEQSFRDLKSGGWHWGESRVRSPEHAARLLILLVLAYVWVIALGSQAVAVGRSQPLIREKDGTLRRHWSLFKEGLRFLVEFVRRYTRCLPLILIPDARFT
jgi:DDE family transposase